ncbi:MAG: flagellar basal body-associated protein FliL [Pseudomonadota bacterium]
MKLLPVIFGVVGLIGGGAAGHFLKPQPDPMPMPDPMAQLPAPGADPLAAATPQPVVAAAPAPQPIPAAPTEKRDFVKLAKQFVVPIVERERVAALIVISLAIEAEPGFSGTVFEYEPKLRDEFLSVMFLHAQSGGFTGVFTAEQVMRDLRQSLIVAAQQVLGPQVHGVLVTDIVRQDI